MDIFDEARQTISAERQDQYGAPEHSFGMIADLWQWHLLHRKPGPLNPNDVAAMMVLFKIARMYGQKYSRDNPRDAIGYLGIYADRLNATIAENSTTTEASCDTCGNDMCGSKYYPPDGMACWAKRMD